MLSTPNHPFSIHRPLCILVGNAYHLSIRRVLPDFITFCTIYYLRYDVCPFHLCCSRGTKGNVNSTGTHFARSLVALLYCDKICSRIETFFSTAFLRRPCFVPWPPNPQASQKHSQAMLTSESQAFQFKRKLSVWSIKPRRESKNYSRWMDLSMDLKNFDWKGRWPVRKILNAFLNKQN